MSDVFISYSRRDSEFVRKLHARLVSDEHDIWVDWEDIPPTADWWQEIQSAIEEAHIFAFIISPESVQSDICRQEIQYAIDNNKRFIPILYKEIDDVNAPHVHSAIRSHNWILYDNPAEEDKAYQKLVSAFTTEPDYLRRHTRLLVRAKEWDANERQTSYMLEGAELREFQAWLNQSKDLEPKPTDLQYDFILASQTQRTRVQLRLAGATVIVFVVVSILSVFTILQQQQLEDQQVEQAFIEATAAAQGTQIAAQQTNIAEVRINATTIIQQANLQNTQSALRDQITDLEGTVNAFETQSAVTNTPIPTWTLTASPTITPSPTVTNTLPPTWTATVEVLAQATIVTTDDARDEDDGENGAEAAGMASPTVDPVIVVSATAQQNIYNTATIEAQATATPRPTDTPVPTATLTPSPVPTATPDLPDPVEQTVQTVTYIVQEGDFAVDIAARFGVSTQELADFNDLDNVSLIFVGQELQIPYELGVETDETLFVAPTGNDNPRCGAQTQPCQTINGAIDVAQGFAEIRIASGVYQETVHLNDDVALVGNGIDNTVITGDFTETIITINPETTVNILGMNITGGSAVWGGGIVNYGELNLQNVRVSGNVGELAGGGVANFGTLLGNFIEFQENYAPYYADIYNAPDAGFVANNSIQYTPETSLPDAVEDVRSQVNIGALVEVTTTEGDRLNLRPEPNVNANPPVPLVAGTPLLVIGGPRENNGFRWWRVQTVVGTTGWAVDFDDEPTLTVINKPDPPPTE